MEFYNELKKLGFKFTPAVPSGPVYIMKDGNFLDLRNSKNVKNGDGTGFSTHSDLDMYLIDEGYINPDENINRVLCSSDNAIRCNDGSNFMIENVIGLPNSMPTTDQFESLKNWLYYMMGLGRHSVAVGNDNSTNIFKTYDFNEYLPEDIIKRIKRYYSTGKLLDSEKIKK